MAKKRFLPPGMRKKQLLESARKILNKKGYSLTRISDIVKDAGVSQGTFYLYFGSKEDVVVELGNCLIEEAMSEIEKNCDPANETMETTLASVLAGYYQSCARYEDVIACAGNGGRAGISESRWNQIYDPLNRYALGLVQTWQERGELAADHDPDTVSWLLIDTVNGGMGRILGASGSRVSDDYEAHILRWTLAALRNYR